MDRRKTEESYLGKTKDIMKYFNKPMEKVETEELREFSTKTLKRRKKIIRTKCKLLQFSNKIHV